MLKNFGQGLKMSTKSAHFVNKNLKLIDLKKSLESIKREYSSFLNKNRVLLNYEITLGRTKKYYSKYKYTAKVEDAVNKQILAEQQASQDYLSMAVIFLHPCVSKPGAGGYFMRMYEEEIGHMQDFIQYQLLRGGTTVINGLKAPEIKRNLTVLDAFTKGLEMEKNITEVLENLIIIAESVKDYHCADFVTSVFMAEQMRSVNEMSHHVTKLSKLCDNEHALYHYDLKLEKKYPWSYKSRPQV